VFTRLPWYSRLDWFTRSHYHSGTLPHFWLALLYWCNLLTWLALIETERLATALGPRFRMVLAIDLAHLGYLFHHFQTERKRRLGVALSMWVMRALLKVLGVLGDFFLCKRGMSDVMALASFTMKRWVCFCTASPDCMCDRDGAKRRLPDCSDIMVLTADLVRAIILVLSLSSRWLHGLHVQYGARATTWLAHRFWCSLRLMARTPSTGALRLFGSHNCIGAVVLLGLHRFIGTLHQHGLHPASGTLTTKWLAHRFWYSLA
jgi:hypothetical protein